MTMLEDCIRKDLKDAHERITRLQKENAAQAEEIESLTQENERLINDNRRLREELSSYKKVYTPKVLLTVREACRRRLPLDGADAQGLEGALQLTERERNRAVALLREILSQVPIGNILSLDPLHKAHNFLAEIKKKEE